MYRLLFTYTQCYDFLKTNIEKLKYYQKAQTQKFYVLKRKVYIHG